MEKVWLITGSSRGLGRSLAEAVLANGDRLVATARDTADVADLVAAGGDRAIAVALDVTDPAAAEAAVAAGVEAFGRIDVVVNNAGYATMGSIEETPPDVYRAVIETNLFGVINVSRAAIPVLRRQGSGHFLQISTVGGRLAPGWGLSSYSASKHGVEGFSEALNNEMSGFGVKVTILEPSGFRTDWAGSSMQHVEPGEAYKDTVGAMTSHFRDNYVPVGDPAKAAQVMIAVTEMAEPPLRLPLGSDAVSYIRAADERKLQQLAEWEELSASTDADDAVYADLSGIVNNG